MSLVKINSVEKAASGRTYALSLTGVPFFPRTKTMKVEPNTFGWVVPTSQTQTMKDGKLVPLETPRMVNILTAVFPDKASAIKAIAEEQSLDFELQSAVTEIAKEFGITAESMKKLEGAAI